jgi:oxygen-independent coproporphyrinogen-3 oxidase
MENWLGAGPGASGTIFDDEDGTAIRRTIPSDVNAFLGGNAIEEIEHVSRDDLLKEMILMGFRYMEGPNPALIQKRFGKTIEMIIPETLKRWQKRELLQKSKTALNKEGLLFLNSFIREAFVELENEEAQK